MFVFPPFEVDSLSCVTQEERQCAAEYALTYELIIRGKRLKPCVGVLLSEAAITKPERCFFYSVGEESERMWGETDSAGSHSLSTDVNFPVQTPSL